jgi:predicted ATPase
MITRVEIDGFKSLSNFELNLNSGLNILVGPNGSGKTNIVLFFEFLSKISRSQIGSAVSSVGGAGAIFKKIGSNEYQNEISFKIFGCNNILSKKPITYEYCAKIKSSFEIDSIFYSYQNLKLRSGSKFWDNPKDINYSLEKWDLSVTHDKTDSKKKTVTVDRINKRKIRPRFFGGSENKKGKLEESIIEIVNSSNPSFKNIIGCLFPIVDEMIFAIHSDIIGGETFNIVPSKVKELEDAATPAGIKKDGSGLSTTLYAMKKSKGKKEGLPNFIFSFDIPERTYDPETLEKIVSYLKLANNSITNLDIENDPFDNKLVVKIFIQTADYDAVLPLSAMSDGTIKWLALITAILTSKSIFSIEEPENYLHPWMQAEIANIMRSHLSDKKEKSFVLMTTHSESLLNHSEPNEVILVDLVNGSTKAKRIANIDLVKEEISNSGFGLGHFYFSNSLEDE